MKLRTLYVAVAGICSAFTASASTIQLNDDIKLDWGMDAYVRSHVIDPSEGDTTHGFTSRFRLKTDLLLNDGWSIHTRMQAYYDWAGDRRHSGSPGTNYTSDDNVDGLSVDLGFVQYSNDGFLLRAGRQRADWAYGFNINNDRRDRFLAMQSYGYGQDNNVSLIGIYDLRFAEDQHESDYDIYDDVDMYALAAMGKHGILDWGMLWAYFHGDKDNAGNSSLGIPQVGYGIDYFHNISPFFTLDLNPIELKGAVNVILSDSTEENGYHTTWGKDGIAGFLEVTYKLSSEIKLQAQAVSFADGGLIGRGFDTYSGLINNSDRNNPSPIYSQFFGGLGHEDNDGEIYAARVDWQLSDDWNIKLAGGHMSIDNVLGSHNDIKSTFADVKTQYKWSKYTDFEVQVSWADQDIDAVAAMAVVNIKYN